MKKNYSNKINPNIIPAFVLSVIKRLDRAGFKSYLVGGAVRDILLGRPVMDWDITTSASNNEISSIFHEIRHFPLKHKTVTLVHKGSHYEVTSMRGSEPSSNTIEEDLGHRDFTINAMAYDLVKDIIIDPYGGNKDLRKRIIRAVKDPFERFCEDPLRLIRAIRICIELRFRIDKGTMEAIIKMAPRLKLAAGERIRDELLKILLIKQPSSGFRLLRKSGLLVPFLPELMEGFSTRQNIHHRYTVFRHMLETVDMVEPDPVLRLAALFHDIAKPRVKQKINGRFRFYGHAEESALLASEIMGRLKFSNEITRKVTNLITHHMIEYNSQWSDGAVTRLIRRFHPDPIEALLSLRRADLLAHGTANKDLDLLSELETRINTLKRKYHATDICDLALDGEKVMEILGLPPGPEVGKALDFLLEKVIDQPQLNSEAALTALLKERSA